MGKELNKIKKCNEGLQKILDGAAIIQNNMPKHEAIAKSIVVICKTIQKLSLTLMDETLKAVDLDEFNDMMKGFKL